MAEMVESLDDASEPHAVPCSCGSGYETRLRCQKCGKPICPKCAMRHPVGLRCREHATPVQDRPRSPRITGYVGAAIIGLVCLVLGAALSGGGDLLAHQLAANLMWLSMGVAMYGAVLRLR